MKRWESCYVLSSIGDKRGIPAVVRALYDENGVVRGVAACALGQRNFFNDPDAQSALQEAAKTEDSKDVQITIDKSLNGQFKNDP